MSFRVEFYDFRNHHDWIGPKLIKGGRRRPRVRPPPKQKRDFKTREAAEEFVRNLRHDIGEDEVAARIIEPKAPPPLNTPDSSLNNFVQRTGWDFYAPDKSPCREKRKSTNGGCLDAIDLFAETEWAAPAEAKATHGASYPSPEKGSNHD